MAKRRKTRKVGFDLARAQFKSAAAAKFKRKAAEDTFRPLKDASAAAAQCQRLRAEALKSSTPSSSSRTKCSGFIDLAAAKSRAEKLRQSAVIVDREAAHVPQRIEVHLEINGSFDVSHLERCIGLALGEFQRFFGQAGRQDVGGDNV